MHLFQYQDGHLWCESRPVADLVSQFGTPLYLYSTGTLHGHYERLREAFAALDPLICFSVKSCPNLAILRLLKDWGSGFDVVSGGELYRALQTGVASERIVFAGVGKSAAELREGLDANIAMINVESASELELLAHVAAEAGAVPNVAIRMIPDVDAKTHAYTTTGTKANKFGLTREQTLELFERFGDSKVLNLRGLHLHIGSPVYDVQSYGQAIERALDLIDTLAKQGIRVDTLDVGGGYGAHYRGSEAPPASAYAEVMVPLLKDRGLRIMLEPGRSVAANGGILVTRVLHTKDTGQKRFVIVDASMTELIRPALYSAYHFIWPVSAGDRIPTDFSPEQPFDGLVTCDVVGPVCESGDFLAQDRALPELEPGDLVAVFTAGAYAMSMASQYNSRPRPPEVLVDREAARLVRRRETYADLVAPEQIDTP